MSAVYLTDTSAAFRVLEQSELQEECLPALQRGIIKMCDLTELEILYSARSLDERLYVQERLHSLFS